MKRENDLRVYRLGSLTVLEWMLFLAILGVVLQVVFSQWPLHLY